MSTTKNHRWRTDAAARTQACATNHADADKPKPLHDEDAARALLAAYTRDPVAATRAERERDVDREVERQLAAPERLPTEAEARARMIELTRDPRDMSTREAIEREASAIVRAVRARGDR